MKKTQQIIGLPVIEVSTGSQLGTVSGIVVNPDQGALECLLLERERWYGEMRALPFGAVLGVGEFAVTVISGSDVFPVSAKKELISMLERDVPLIKAGVMTRSGKLVGAVREYYVDHQSGKIKGCQVTVESGDEFIVPGDKVMTYGSRFIIIEDGYNDYLIKELPGAAGKEVFGAAAEPEAAGRSTASEDPVDLFEARQRQYLSGKKATRRITGTGGQVIVEEGGVITEEIIEKALAMDKYIELTMNVTD